MTKPKLLASSPYPDFEAIRGMIARYWCCTPEAIKLIEVKAGMVRRNCSEVYKNGVKMSGFRVSIKGKRLCFEYAEGES